MTLPTPHVRITGTGPDVICLHSNASSSAQWRALGEELAADHRTVAPDLYGSSKSAEWPSDHEITLADEVAYIAPVLDASPGPFVLAGHSYGGAVALKAALRDPARVRALVLYEPTLFALVDAHSPPPNGADGIRGAVRASAEALEAGDSDNAARHFIDFWSGTGTWAATPEERKPAMAKAVSKVRRWAHALITEPAPLAAFAALEVPVLYMLGGRSPRSAHAVADVLIPALRDVRVERFPDLGHMGPVTHPQVVNAAIASYLRGIGR